MKNTYSITVIIFALLFLNLISCEKEKISVLKSQILILNNQIALICKENNDEKIHLRLFQNDGINDHLQNTSVNNSWLEKVYFSKLPSYIYNQIGASNQKKYFSNQLSKSLIPLGEIIIPENCVIIEDELNRRHTFSISTPLVSEGGKYAFVEIRRGNSNEGLGGWMVIYAKEGKEWKVHDRLISWIE